MSVELAATVGGDPPTSFFTHPKRHSRPRAAQGSGEKRGGSTVDLANPEEALKWLKAFRGVLKHDYEDWRKDYFRGQLEQLRGMQPTSEAIARRLGSTTPAALREKDISSDAWGWDEALAETSRLIGILEHQDMTRQILGLGGSDAGCRPAARLGLERRGEPVG